MADNKITGYATDQFFNSKVYGEDLNVKETDNPNFAYPGNRGPNVYDRAGDTTNYDPGLIQRGFIRGIFPEILKEAGKTDKSYTSAAKDLVTRRCFFQFNPSLILRSVEASTTVLNPLLQPATELLQPIPGQAAFEFQLLFNREREVSNHRRASGFKSGTGDPTMSEVGTFTASLENYGAEGNAYSPDHVADLGVLSDLYVLDSIIGQSITQDSINALTAYWSIQQKNRVGSESVTENQDGTTTTTTTSSNGDVVVTVRDKAGKLVSETPTLASPDSFGKFDFNSDDTKTKLASVLGNSAFLSPLPVRIVFSSLFMVEGFVTSSAVAFHKFNSKMVPTVCSVTLNVQALYLGFAKKNSYVSQQLATQFTTVAKNKKEETEARTTAKTAMQGLKVALNYVTPHGSVSGDSLNSWWAFGTNNNWNFLQGGRDIEGTGARFDSVNKNNGIICWVDKALAASIKSNNVQNISIEKIELIFINKDKLPPKDRNVAAVKKSLDASGKVPGHVGGSRGGKIVELIRTELNIVDNINQNYLNNGAGANGKSAKDAIETPDIEKSTAAKPIKKPWQSAPLQTGIIPENRFGTTNIMVAMVVKISCNYPFGEVDTSPDTVSIYKSMVIDNVNPASATFITNSKNGKIGFTV